MRAIVRTLPNIGSYGWLAPQKGWLLPIAPAIVILILSWGAVASAVAAERLRIGATQTALLVWIAEARGLFEKNGVDVEVRMFPSGRHTADALIQGEIDFSTSSGSVFASKSFNHADLRILAVISASETAKLVGRRDRGIQVASDLAGKRVGITLKTVSEYFLTRYLSLHDVPVTAPVIVDLKPDDIAEGLVQGTIDAGLSWEPFISNATRALKTNAVILPGQLEQFFYFLLLTKDVSGTKRDIEFQKILLSLIEAEKFSLTNPSEAKSILKKKFGYTQKYIDHLWPLHNLYISLPQGLLFNLEENASWQIRKGLTSAKTHPSFLSFIDTGPLAAVRASSIGIVK